METTNIGEIPMASKETIEFLIKVGVLYADKNGIHCSEPGIYPTRRGIVEPGGAMGFSHNQRDESED